MEHLISRGWYVLKTGAKKSNVKTFSSFSDTVFWEQQRNQ